MGRAAERAGWTCDVGPVADGGEGTLAAFGGTPRSALVVGPLGDPVEAEWRLLRVASDGGGELVTGVVEMARAAGLALVGGPEGNDALRASTRGVGELVAEAVAAGCQRVIVGMGGSATTDGGHGCVQVLDRRTRKAVELVVACDVVTTFVDAAAVFAPQKGASPAEVALLTRRLERLAQLYEDDYGVDVRHVAGAGAAGGLAGGLLALGATLVPGFDLIAETLRLGERIRAADLVVTGEGLLDRQSFDGKAVGGVVRLAIAAGVPVLAIAGAVSPDAAVPPDLSAVTVVSLTDRFGARAFHDPVGCVEEVVDDHIAGAFS